MTIQEMHSWFDLMQDKVDSIYYTSHEKDQFINRAIQLLINDLVHQFQDDQSGRLRIFNVVEESLNVSEVLQPLMLLDLPVTSDANGLVLRTDIDTEIENNSGETGTYAHILAVSTDSGLNVQYVRENDYHKLQQNEFKKASATNPQFRLDRSGLMCSPTGAATYNVSVVKSPTEVDYDAATSTDLPSTVHDYVMAKALELAGIASMQESLVSIRNAV